MPAMLIRHAEGKAALRQDPCCSHERNFPVDGRGKLPRSSRLLIVAAGRVATCVVAFCRAKTQVLFGSIAMPPRHRQKNQFSFLKANLVGRAELWITSVVTTLRIQRRRRREIATRRFTEEDKL
jgi:hypothetical protein